GNPQILRHPGPGRRQTGQAWWCFGRPATSVLFLTVESPYKSIIFPSSRRKPGPIDVRVRVLPSWMRHADRWVPAFAGMTEFASGTKLHADGSFSDFTAIVCIHPQDLSFPTHPKPHREALQADYGVRGSAT